MIHPNIFQVFANIQDKDADGYFPYSRELDDLRRAKDISNCFVYIDKGNVEEMSESSEKGAALYSKNDDGTPGLLAVKVDRTYNLLCSENKTNILMFYKSISAIAFQAIENIPNEDLPLLPEPFKGPTIYYNEAANEFKEGEVLFKLDSISIFSDPSSVEEGVWFYKILGCKVESVTEFPTDSSNKPEIACCA